MSPTEILTFWFGSADPFAVPPANVQRDWFAGGPDFDRAIAERFGPLLDRPEALAEWRGSPAETLAAVIVTDQFPRNIFRGTARAFATDAIARQLAAFALEQGYAPAVGFFQRSFFYLPFEHHEDAASQARSVALYTRMSAEAPPELQDAARNFLAFAESHRAIVARFGRFPGRNSALGRANTPGEDAWLASGGETFGQGAPRG